MSKLRTYQVKAASVLRNDLRAMAKEFERSLNDSKVRHGVISCLIVLRKFDEQKFENFKKEIGFIRKVKSLEALLNFANKCIPFHFETLSSKNAVGMIRPAGLYLENFLRHYSYIKHSIDKLKNKKAV